MERKLDDIISDWFSGSSHYMFLIGEIRSGKTVFVQRLAKIAGDLLLAPVFYLDCRNISGLHRQVPTRQAAVEECLARGYQEPMSYHVLQ